MSWTVYSSAPSMVNKKREAQDNFWWLWERRELLTDEQKSLLWEIYNAKEWKLAAFDWLDAKRAKLDQDYRRIKELNAEIAKRQSAIKEFEAKQALQEHDRQEEVLEVNQKLADENYWLRTELSGLKQTIAWSEKASSK